MATSFITASGGGTGIQHALVDGDNILIGSDVERYSEDDSVIQGAGTNSVVVGPDATLATFSSSFGEAAIELGIRDDFASGGSSVTVAEGALVYSDNGGMEINGGSAEVTIFGTISAATTGIDVYDGELGANVVNNHGSVEGDSIAIRVWQNSILNNHGTASGQFFGLVTRDGGCIVTNSGSVSGNAAVWMGGTGTGSVSNEFVNTGTVLGGDYGVFTNAGGADIVNAGTISSVSGDLGTAAIFHNASVTDDDYVLHNSGDIISALGQAYSGASAVDRIVNTGTITGDIVLGASDDVYRGRNGLADGLIDGGDGNDTIVGGAEDNDIEGGGNNDTLRGGAGADTLSGSAGNDEIRGGADDDVLDGGSGKDDLRGGSGDDRIGGGGANDVIDGGAGSDLLTGGGGSDIFVFGPGDGNDVITDFQDGKDQIDLTAFGLRPADYGTIVAPALSNAGGATLLNLTSIGGSGSVLIEGLDFADADATDFLL